jgi:pimeloyl-ACP methyl ester carboxylesterase
LTNATVPRWTTNDEPTLAAYDALLRRVGPCTIVAHSQGAMFALKAALRAPEFVRAVVAVEPSGIPEATAAELAALRDVPHLFVWGDYIDSHPLWSRAFANSERYVRELRAAGVDCERLLLPDNGIAGNTHLPMLDRNSDHIAQFVRRWLAERLASVYGDLKGR